MVHTSCECNGDNETCTCILRNRGSYMSAHVFLNSLNESEKRDKMRD